MIQGHLAFYQYRTIKPYFFDGIVGNYKINSIFARTIKETTKRMITTASTTAPRQRTRAYLRLRPQLVERLRTEASKRHTSFNSYVERILADAVFDEPNAETVAAIEESRRGEYAGIVQTSSFDAFKRSMGLSSIPPVIRKTSSAMPSSKGSWRHCMRLSNF